MMLRLLVALLLASLAPTPAAYAHESMPIVVTLEEQAPQQYVLGVRLPGNIDRAQRPVLTLASPCQIQNSGSSTALYRCPPGTRPDRVELAWPGGAPSSAILLRSQFLDGIQRNAVAAAGSSELALPQAETAMWVITSYIRIGAEHILFGLDHLLFLACLVLIAETPRRIAFTVTGFTVGHALTITLSSLGLVRVDGPLVEAMIALSIVFVAVELVRARKDTLLTNYPVLVAAGFGTLHGLGFADALAEIGLAQTSIALSLVGFNLGVELGQLLFVLVMLTGVAIWRRMPLVPLQMSSDTIRRATLAVIGVTASFWFWQRSLAIVALPN